MPRPFGVWAPATSAAEFRARCPRFPKDFSFVSRFKANNEVYYNPEAMAHFKDPQQFRDAVDYVLRLRNSPKFFGHGIRLPHNALLKLLACLGVHTAIGYSAVVYYYTQYIPANNPSWRKVVNKEWEEAINNSPWNHMSHVWNYSDASAAHIGMATSRGRRKFYVPA